MRLSHAVARTSVAFDDPNLVSHAGLVPVMALAARAGLHDLASYVGPAGDCGANAGLKVGCLVAGMARPPCQNLAARLRHPASHDSEHPGVSTRNEEATDQQIQASWHLKREITRQPPRMRAPRPQLGFRGHA